MPVSAEAEQALPRFVEAVAANDGLQGQLNAAEDLEALKAVLHAVEPLSLIHI